MPAHLALRAHRVGVATLACALGLAVLATAAGPDAHRAWWENAHWTAAAALAALLAVRGAMVAPAADRRTRRLLAAGFLLWLAGQLAWDVQAMVGVQSLLGPSDVAYAASALAFAAALLAGVSEATPAEDRQAYLDSGTAFCALCGVVVALAGTQAGAAEAELAAVAAGAAYPIAFGGTALAATVALLSRGRGLDRWNALLLGALGALGIAWMAWLGDVLAGTPVAGTPAGYLFSLALVVAAGAGARWRTAGPELEAAEGRPIAMLIPLPSVIASIAVLAVVEAENALATPAGIAAALAILLAVVRQTMLVRERTRFVRRERERLVHQRRLLSLNEELLRTSSADTVLESIADALSSVVAYDTLTVYLADKDHRSLVPVLARDRYADEVMRSPLPWGTGITGDAVVQGQAILVNDAGADPRATQIPGTPVVREALIVAPLMSPDGPLGSLNLYREGSDFEPGDLELARLYASQAAIALDTANRHGRLFRAAQTDPLTGLLNRAAFLRAVDDRLVHEDAGLVAVLFLDLDGFKLVNDSLGHGAGDDLLRAVSERLRTALRPSDAIARVGGDEFAVVAAVRTVHEAEAIARRLLAGLRSPFSLPAAEILVRGSIGISTSAGAEDREALLSHADAAMYEAKARGKDRYEVFRPELHERAVARLELERDLRYGLERDEFIVHFQPVVDLPTGRVVGHEALVRWMHPARGLLMPGAFITAAEETGLIVPLGRRVLHRALGQLAAWTERGWQGWVSVNLAPRQLLEAESQHAVAALLAAHDISPDRLHLEITESAALAQDGRGAEVLNALARLGVRIVLDDFGTGYSSLQRAAELPVDALKIDRSFVAALDRDRTRAAIAEATIAFGHALGVPVVGEGIETVEQESALLALGCDLGQGYLYGRAAPGESGPPGVTMARAVVPVARGTAEPVASA